MLETTAIVSVQTGSPIGPGEDGQDLEGINGSLTYL
jgi:hypothetical protein